jgi:hypothetical protein
MNRTLCAVFGLALAVAAGPLVAQTPAVPSPAAPEARTVDDPAIRPAGRISETAPAPVTAPAAGAGSGDARYRADLAGCATLDPESRTSCRREMNKARAQGLYRN